MSLKNTTKKGDFYEQFVIERLQTLINNGSLGLIPEMVKITPKKKYHIHTGNDIEVDIVLEVYRQGAEKPINIWYIECKNYTRRITTEKLNDVHTKMGLIGAHKGMIFTSVGFNSGVIKQANYFNIACVKYAIGDKEETWFVERNESGAEEIPNVFVGYVGDVKFNSLTNLLTSFAFNSRNRILVPFKPIEFFQNVASQIVQKAHLKYNPYLDTTELIINVLTKIVKYAFSYVDLPDGKLGLCDFGNHLITITSSLNVLEPRFRFTLAHEIAHAILHSKYFPKGSCLIHSDSEDSFRNFGKSEIDIYRMEFQANTLASYLLMPQDLFADVYVKAYENIGIPKRIFPKVYVDNMGYNLKDYYALIDSVAKKFNVSHPVVEIRMKQSGLVEDHREDGRLDCSSFFSQFITQ